MMMGRLLAGVALLLSLGGPCFAASAVTESDIRAWLALWQEREGLSGWNTNLQFVGYQVLRKHDAIADVRWWEPEGTITIRIIYPSEFETVENDTPAEARREAEETVIHELMHVVLAALYDDYSGRGNQWMEGNPVTSRRLNVITDNLAEMLLRRRVPGGVSEARYINRQLNGGPWKPARDVKERVMLQLVRAMEAASEGEVVALLQAPR